MSGNATVAVTVDDAGVITSDVQAFGMRRRELVRALRGVINVVQAGDVTPPAGTYPPAELMSDADLTAHLKGADPEHNEPARAIPPNLRRYHVLLHEDPAVAHTHDVPLVGYVAIPPE